MHPEVGVEHAVEPAQQDVPGAVRAAAAGGVDHRVGDVEVRDLTPRVHAGVGAAGDGQRRPLDAEHGVERPLELALHRAQAGLPGPAVEAAPVVPQIDPQPHGGILPPLPGCERMDA